MPRIKLSAIPGFAIKHRRFPELTYACANDPGWKRWFIARVETLSGRGFFARRYNIWRAAISAGKPAMGSMLDLLDIKLTVNGRLPEPGELPDAPLVIVANHPFGIGDGVAILSLAERMGRPFRVLINNELMKVPEIAPYALPISFAETREATRLNLETRREAIRLLNEGVTIIAFPGGGVATARKGFGKAEDLPWKRFPARLIQAANASVLPVFFEGQCGRSFQLASRISLTLRTALLIREFRRLAGREIRAHVGDVLSAPELARIGCRQELTRHLHDTVFSLAPAARKRVLSMRRRPLLSAKRAEPPMDDSIAA
ncbi:lysophospholipid acyltransferase family protein [Salaquimonas pukyongi]|uniref:lysophospholipid acyltransferase family protein n=1 Tax=Salaquimonas pukyongi TaxID=2712698 RepID=UPI00096BB318|nr:lysophospholipid acyltransferase family protein [Salaquimonas pukyongi]